MLPIINLPWLGIALSVLASFVFGFLWFGPIFGEKWAKLMGFPDDFKPETSELLKSMSLNIFGAFLTSYVITHSIQSWMPSAWNLEGTEATHMYGMMAGFFIFLGYILPMLLSQLAWEGKGMPLFLINFFYHLISLQIVAAIICSFL